MTLCPGIIVRQRASRRLSTASLWGSGFFVRGYIVCMEQELISWIKRRVSETINDRGFTSVVLGIGDDGAVLGRSKCKRVFVSDTIVEGVHFDSLKDDLELIGRKAIAVNLSDIAAMGATAESALVSVVLPKGWQIDQCKRMLNGLIEMAAHCNVAIIGGDTVRHDGELMICVSVTGELLNTFGAPDGWRMDGAKVDDILVVTGPLGGSLLGKHLRFDPRLDLAEAIQKRTSINAATDISDSLTVDLAHILRQSHVGATLDEDQIPVSSAAKELSKTTLRSPLEHAYSDGEDFELLLSMTPEAFEKLVQDSSFEFQLYPIGRVVSEHPGKIVSSDTNQEVRISGYEH